MSTPDQDENALAAARRGQGLTGADERVRQAVTSQPSAAVTATQPDAETVLGLSERAYQELRDAVLAGTFQPGDRLSVPEIAKKLGVSRSPAREAITRIAQEGLATVTRNRGAVVAAFDRRDLIEIYRIREMLEALACRLAATQASEHELSRMHQLHDEHAGVVGAGDVERHYDLDARFHAAIREAADSPRLSESLEMLQGQIRLGMHTTHRSPGAMDRAVRDHWLILSAVESGSPEFAENAVRMHIRRLTTELEHRDDQAPGSIDDQP